MGKLGKIGVFEFSGTLESVTVTIKGDEAVMVAVCLQLTDASLDRTLSVTERIATCYNTPVVLRLYDPDS